MIFPILIAMVMPFLQAQKDAYIKQEAAQKVLATHVISLDKRYANTFVNDVFKDNILLALGYATGKPETTKPNWNVVEKPAQYKITLKKGETFAFHDTLLSQYKDKVDETTNSYFSGQEGYKFDGDITGDGVCHLASLMYWVAKDAGLSAYAPVRHDFAPVPQIPREFGVSIFADPNHNDYSSQMQNLYITNNKDQTIAFNFIYDGQNLTLQVDE